MFYFDKEMEEVDKNKLFLHHKFELDKQKFDKHIVDTIIQEDQ